jgi:DNA-binding protein HU-beta
VKPAPKTTAKSAATKPVGGKSAPKAAAAAPKTLDAPKAAAAAKSAAPVKKAVAKKAPASSSTSMPLIDTNLAAQNAASMLLNRSTDESTPAESSEPAKESTAFKNLKEQLAKPKPTGLSGLFGPTGEQKKSGGGFNVNQQRGHNQTFGGMKTGVPRRTNG